MKFVLPENEEDDIPGHKSKTDKFSERKDSAKCPVCSAKLKRNGKGTKRQNRCESCNATLAKELKCEHCRTNRVWRGSLGSYCHGCGHRYDT